MGTIIIKLDSRKLKNPDLDIIYRLPELIEKYSNEKITDDGYDYLSDYEIAVYLKSQNTKNDCGILKKFISENEICGNNLSNTAEIYISDKDNVEINECRSI